MAELRDSSAIQGEYAGPKFDVKVNGRSSFDAGRRSTTPSMELEGEKERALAQAALSVAEIGSLRVTLTSPFVSADARSHNLR